MVGGRVGRVAFQPVDSIGRALRQSPKEPEKTSLAGHPLDPAWGGGSDAWSLCLEGTDLTVRPPGTPAGGGEGCRRIAPLLKRAATYVSEDEIGQAGNLFHDFQIYF